MITLRQPRTSSVRTTPSKTLSSLRNLKSKRLTWLTRFHACTQVTLSEGDNDNNWTLVYA